MSFGNSTRLLELLDERAALGREIGLLKGRMTQAEQEITELTKPALDNAFKREGKPHGTVKFLLDNHAFKAVVERRVEWDSDALEAIARGMIPDQVRDLFKVKYSMAEARFKDVIDPTLRAKLTVARAVKYGEPKISLAD